MGGEEVKLYYICKSAGLDGVVGIATVSTIVVRTYEELALFAPHAKYLQ